MGRTGCCQTSVAVKGLDLLPFRKSQQYDCKWYIPLTDLSFQMVDESEAVPNIPLVPDEELDAMKIKISQIKNDIQREKVKEVGTPGQCTHTGLCSEEVLGQLSQGCTGWGASPVQQGLCSSECTAWVVLPCEEAETKPPCGCTQQLLCSCEHPCGGQGSYAADMKRTGSVICQFLAVKL